jgi:hypothetical protein
MTVTTSVATAHDPGLVPPKKRRACFNKPSCSIQDIDESRDELESTKTADDICALLEDLIKQNKLDPNQVITLADKRTMTLEDLLKLAKKSHGNQAASDALKSGMSLELMKLKREAIDHILKEMDRYEAESAGLTDREKKDFVAALIRYSKEHNLCSAESLKKASNSLAKGHYDEAFDLIKGQVNDLKQRLNVNMNRAQVTLLAMRLGRSTPSTFSPIASSPPPPSNSSKIATAQQTLSPDVSSVICSLQIDEPKKSELFKHLQAALEALDEKKLLAQKLEQEQSEESRQEALQEIRIVEKICHELGVPESYIQLQFAHLESLPVDSLRALILNVKKQFETNNALKANA